MSGVTGAVAAYFLRLIVLVTMVIGVNGGGSVCDVSVVDSSWAAEGSRGIVDEGLWAHTARRSARFGQLYLWSPGLQPHRLADTAPGSRGWRGRKRSLVALGAVGRARATGGGMATGTLVPPDGSYGLQLYHLFDMFDVVHCRGDWKRSWLLPESANEWALMDHEGQGLRVGVSGGRARVEKRGCRSVWPCTLLAECPFLQLYHPAEAPLTGRGWRGRTRSLVASVATWLTHAMGYPVLALGVDSSYWRSDLGTALVPSLGPVVALGGRCRLYAPRP